MFQPVYSRPPSSASYFATRRRRCFMERGWIPDDDEEVDEAMREMETAYPSWQTPDAQQPSFGVGVPAAGFRQNRYLAPMWGAGGNSARRHD